MKNLNLTITEQTAQSIDRLCAKVGKSRENTISIALAVLEMIMDGETPTRAEILAAKPATPEKP